MSKKTSFILLIVTLILAGLFASYTMRKSLSGPIFAVTPTPPPSAGVPTNDLSTFASDAYQFSLAFPQKYFITARELDASSTPNLLVVLLLDTKENRDLLLGTSQTPRDGTTGITLNVHKNSKKLALLSGQKLTPIGT